MELKNKIVSFILCAAMLIGMGFSHTTYATETKTEWNFDYVGYVEEWTAPYTGKYLLDTYGASGGGTKSGGGHSFGYINLYAGEKLYIIVGQQGSISPASGWSPYPYNGGGRAFGGAGSGGGATAITKQNRGELKNFENYKNEVVIVAGASGGIGSSWKYSSNGCYVIDDYLDKGYYDFVRYRDEVTPSTSTVNAIVSDGGGLQGAGCYIRSVTRLDQSHDGHRPGEGALYMSTGGDYIGGGYAFGQGGSGSSIPNAGYGGGAGSGYYGGYAYDKQPNDGSEYRSCGLLFGAGGAGYLSNELFEMASVSNANVGNGKASITFAGEVTSNYIIDIGNIGTINGKSGTVTISGKAGMTGIIPKIILKEGYKINGWKVEYNECNTSVRPSVTEDVSIAFGFGDIRISPEFAAPIYSNVQAADDTTLDLIYTEEDNYEKVYAISESYDGGETFSPVSADTSKNSLNIYHYNFGYTGNVQQWNVAFTGNWLLEVSGGSASSKNQTKTGGYSKGYKRLSKGDSLFIACGGNGGLNTSGTPYSHGVAGWNGGGYGWTASNHGPDRWTCGSGGATSITTVNRGVLANFKNYKNEVVIVAGGAGSGGYTYGSRSGEGCFLDWRPGSQKPLGGGLVGGNGCAGSSGGGQNDNGYFGQGAYFASCPRKDCGAGGGGWYGGTLGTADEPAGGGGSGYIGGVTNGQSVMGGAKTYAGSAEMTYEKAITSNTRISDLKMTDKAAPYTPSDGTYTSNGENIYITWTDNGDRGSDIIFRIQSFLKDTSDYSDDMALNTKMLNYSYTSGVKGFYYYIDVVAIGNAGSQHTFTSDVSIEVPTSSEKRFLHVAAIDHTGNISGTYNMEIPTIAKYIVNHYAQNEDGTYTLVETEEKMGTIGTSVTPPVHPQTGRDNPPVQSVVITADGKATVNYYYDVTKFDVTGTVSWNDKKNLYKTRPDDIGVTIFKDSEYFDYVTVSAAEISNGYGFKVLQKYDLTTGREFVYTVAQDVAYSQAADATSEDKYVTKQSGFNFLNTIRNTDADRPEDPDPNDKGFYVEGNIYWEDNDDSLGFRPSESTITLYQKGEDGEWRTFREPIVVDSKTENHYLFDWLPKYWYDENDEPTAYEYKVEESFTAWYVEDGVIKDAYTIIADQPSDFDFTNVFNKPSGPIIPVNEHNNTLTIITNTDEEVRIILKPLELLIGNDYSVSYGDETGCDLFAFVDKDGSIIDHIPSTRYEVVVDSPEYNIDDMVLSLADNMLLEYIDEKYYVTIKNVPDDAFGTLEIELSKKEKFYQDRERINNYFAISKEKEKQAENIKKMSRFVAKPDNPIRILYMDSNTEDIDYESGEQAEILDYLGEIPEGMIFTGWSETKDSKEAEYLVGDEVILEDTLILYPVFADIEETENKTSALEG